MACHFKTEDALDEVERVVGSVLESDTLTPAQRVRLDSIIAQTKAVRNRRLRSAVRQFEAWRAREGETHVDE